MEISLLVDRIRGRLGDQTEVFVRDLTGNGDHFEAFVVSSIFAGKSRIQKHQLVMDPLKDLMSGPLHALTIKTYTPEEWEIAQNA